MTRILGLFGISGAGKTWLAQRATRTHPNLLHLQASQLLSKAHMQSGESLRISAAENVRRNQLALEEAFRDARAGREDDPVILDAHSVIDNDRELVRIPVSAIEPLGLTDVFFLEAEPEEIARRRAADGRPRPFRSPEQLRSYQNVAREVCTSYARDLGIPFSLVRGDHEGVHVFLEAIVERG